MLQRIADVSLSQGTQLLSENTKYKRQHTLKHLVCGSKERHIWIHAIKSTTDFVSLVHKIKYYTLKHGSVAQIISRSNRPLLKTRHVCGIWPATERVESVDCCHSELLSTFGAWRVASDGAQPQSLVIPEAGTLHQLLHGGLIWGLQSAAGGRFAVVRYCDTHQ